MTKIAERADLLVALGEVFRAHGYEGATLALIGKATGLGKGSLYSAFPGGKTQMASEVLADIDRWFADNVFAPLRRNGDAAQGIVDMFAAVDGYFRSGRRVCLVGVVALGAAREPFAAQVRGYFVAWADALATALRLLGHDRAAARALSEDTLLAIQGALVLGRALDDPGVFSRALGRMQARLLSR